MTLHVQRVLVGLVGSAVLLACSQTDGRNPDNPASAGMGASVSGASSSSGAATGGAASGGAAGVGTSTGGLGGGPGGGTTTGGAFNGGAAGGGGGGMVGSIEAYPTPAAGSLKDEESIAAANEHAIVMVFTGIRHFKH